MNKIENANAAMKTTKSQSAVAVAALFLKEMSVQKTRAAAAAKLTLTTPLKVNFKAGS